MKRYRILIWFPHKSTYYDGLFKSLNSREDVECKDKSDFGFEVNYRSQQDYEKVQSIFRGNIIILYQISKKELYIDIPDDIIVWSYLDDIFGKFVMVGKDFFEKFPANNYMYLPTFDVDAFDIEGAMKSEDINKKAVIAPFVPLQHTYNLKLTEDERKKFSSDIVLILFNRKIGSESFKYLAGINNDNAFSAYVTQLRGLLCRDLYKEILNRESIITDEVWIEKLLIKYFDKMNTWQYARDKEKLLERWKRQTLFILNVQLYGKAVIEWLMEQDYNLKLWGGWDEKKYERYNMGYLYDGTIDMYYANSMAKIGINSNPFISIHRRTISCMSSGTMCISAAADTEYADKKYNFSHYSHFFENKKSIVMFHNKKELIESVDYYLTHEEKREKIAENGKKIVSDCELDYVNVVNKAFEELINKVNENGEKIN